MSALPRLSALGIERMIVWNNIHAYLHTECCGFPLGLAETKILLGINQSALADLLEAGQLSLAPDSLRSIEWLSLASFCASFICLKEGRA